MLRKCLICLCEKDTSVFGPMKRGRDGLDSYCRPCRSKKKKLNETEEQRERGRQAARDRCAANRPLARQKTNEWRAKKKKQNPAYFLWVAAKTRAKKQNIPFSITEQDIVIPEYCPVLGVKLDTQTKKGFCNNAASIDKTIPALGYVPGNIIIISWRANRIKYDATLEELNKVASFYSQFIT